MRIIAAVMLVYVPAIAIVIERVRQNSGTVGRTFFTAICSLSLAVIVIGFFLRRKFVENSANALHLNPDDAKPLNKWRTGQIISFALAESIALYGVVIRLLGGTLQQAALFYGAAIAMFILWWPQAP